MVSTTIKIYKETKSKLDRYREYKNESYDEVINKLVYIANNIQKNPRLSEETIKGIESARKRIRDGRFITEKEARQRLGF